MYKFSINSIRACMKGDIVTSESGHCFTIDIKKDGSIIMNRNTVCTYKLFINDSILNSDVGIILREISNGSRLKYDHIDYFIDGDMLCLGRKVG